MDEGFATVIKNCDVLKEMENSYQIGEAEEEDTRDLSHYEDTKWVIFEYSLYTKKWLYNPEKPCIGFFDRYFYLEEGCIVLGKREECEKLDIKRLDDLLLVEKW